MTRMMMKKDSAPAIALDVAHNNVLLEQSAVELENVTAQGGKEQEQKSETSDPETGFEGVGIRKNLQETAFFFPQLTTDEEGNVSFSFTTPEALTKWKLQLLAHTKTLESRTTALETVTQKELMVIPNAPRFLREGDQIVISSKIANLTEKNLSGKARLELTDPLSGKPITDKLLLAKTSGATIEETNF